MHQTEGPVTSPAELAAEVATLRDAIATRTVIGQATGLLAGQLSIPTEVAWRVMRRLSNETNIKLRDIARALVDAHDGRRSPGDAEIGRAIGAAIGQALAAAQEEPDDLFTAAPDGSPHTSRDGAHASREASHTSLDATGDDSRLVSQDGAGHGRADA